MENKENFSGMGEKDRTLKFMFIGIKHGEEQPKLALFAIDPNGQIMKMESFESNKTSLSELRRNMKEERIFGFGPDIDEKDITEDMLITFRQGDKVDEWANIGLIEINPKWRAWIHPFICVHGNVKKCLPHLIQISQLLVTHPTQVSSFNINANVPSFRRDFPTPIPHPIEICAPICNAVVEIYEKTCCCKITIPDLDDFLVRIKDWFLKFPPPPPDPPFTGPTPDPMRDLDPIPDRATDRALKFARSSDIKVPLGNPPQRLLQDVQILSSLSPSEKLAYVDIHDYLYPLFCYCTSKKVGETTLNEKGEFSHCFPKKFYIRSCRTTYFYKVRQWQENQWVYVYDGSNVNEYFRADEEAFLRTWKGIACRPDEGIIPVGEFVLLENIGAIPSWELDSPAQNSEFGVSFANTDDGLVNHHYTGQPWGKTLSFRLKFSEGLKVLGAKYYRISVVKADSNGNPISTLQPLNEALSWRRWIMVSGQIKTEAVTLGPNVAGSEGALYQIPYEADAPLGWLWFQFHHSWNTSSHDNGKHLVIIEIFDNAGNRLKSVGSPGTGIAKTFSYRRWVDEENTVAVNFAALTHMFHVDNVHCYADIVDFRKNGVSSIEECQFITGCTTDQFTVGYYTFHINGFMRNYILWSHRGLNGPNLTLASGTTNAPVSIPTPLNSANAAESDPKTFQEMLEEHSKCSFSIQLRVYPKHTNGFGIIWEYGSSDNAAVALEKVSCISLVKSTSISAKAPAAIGSMTSLKQ